MHGKTPPKKVIRAIASYRSQSPQELSFESGDFFHVVGERVDAAAAEIEWFDAANPLTGARGLVPARCFQILGRNEKENAAVAVAQHTRNGSMHSNAATLSPPLGGSGSGSGSQGHSSSQFHSQQQQQQQYGQRGNNSSTSLSRQSAGSNGTVPSPSSGTFPNGAGGSSRLSKPSSATTGSGSRAKTQPLYGVVQYDFVAERADELDAKKGESIIVIAQSNHEWFVAKPIGRLGGPGLIPVSFVAISDTTTGGWLSLSRPLLCSAGEASPLSEHRLG
jgi:bud emergence protein 1